MSFVIGSHVSASGLAQIFVSNPQARILLSPRWLAHHTPPLHGVLGNLSRWLASFMIDSLFSMACFGPFSLFFLTPGKPCPVRLANHDAVRNGTSNMYVVGG